MPLRHDIAYYKGLDSIAKQVIEVLADMIGVNTIFLARNDMQYNYIVKAFNRQEILLKEGDVQPFQQVLCRLLVDRGDKPFVISDLTKHPLTKSFAAAGQLEEGCFLGTAIRREDGTMFGTLCAFDSRPYAFTEAQVRGFHTLAQLIQKSIELEHQLIRDSLTGLYNRSFIKGYLSYLEEQKPVLTVLSLNLDQFSMINEAFGQEAGDEALQEIGRRLTACLPQEAIVSRTGSDEYVVLLPGDEQNRAAAAAALVLEQIRTKPLQLQGLEVYITGRIGLSFYPQDGVDMGTVLKKAEIALCTAKEQGGNQALLFEEETMVYRSRSYQLKQALHKAMVNAEMSIVYQPQFHLDGQTLVGFEALLRWHHPEHGLVAPGEFVPLAEEMGLIGELGQWVLEEVCRQGAAWRKQGLPPVYLSVNLSPLQFEDAGLVQKVACILQQTGFDGRWLKLEITESQLMKNSAYTLHTLQQLKALGVHISVDDFGTGYSSLQYLTKYPVDCLKLDRHFSMNLEDEKHQAVAKIVITLAHSLGIPAVAEGVETAEQLQFLQQEGCDWGQGFFLGRPLSVQAAEKMYRTYTI